jgi:adenosylcobinamide-GDP ribazoletransferase
VLAPSYVIIVLISVLVTNYLFAKWCTSRIGGATGDTLGAICELTEMVTAITFTASFTTF